jgi:hypothetical protein
LGGGGAHICAALDHRRHWNLPRLSSAPYAFELCDVPAGAMAARVHRRPGRRGRGDRLGCQPPQTSRA